MEPAKQDEGKLLIRKATMIRKNDAKIEDVYKISKNALGTGGFGVVSAAVHKETK